MVTLVLPDLCHKVLGSNPARGGIQLITVGHFITQSPPLSSYNLHMTNIMLKETIPTNHHHHHHHRHSEKIKLNISCESSARQMIHMKCQALFSLNNVK